eukprot:TRINITY_DN11424_c0_g1_i1.p1 TRINITY_DN11424_c0_g1~~TRINITY_DN11424_c0_g1_i1.p1  ORF type:complete len:708 (+),score=140.07 TRINITY_DN11424_c0_g1_i1:65-2125(+)
MDKKVIKEATKPAPEPTMGHMYRDIATMTQVDGKTCDKVAAFVFSRLTGSTNPYQIQKSLKVIKYVAANGHTDFQRWYQRKTDELRAYANYKGAEDPVFGSSLNDQIRAAAREAIESCASERVVGKLAKLEGYGGGAVSTGAKNDVFKEHVAMPSVGAGSATGAEKFQQEFNRVNGLGGPQPKPPLGQESQFEQFKQAAKGGFGLFAHSTNHTDLARQMQLDQTGSYSGITLDLDTPAPIGGGIGGTGGAPAPAHTPFRFLNEGKEQPSLIPAVTDSSIALNKAQLVVDNFTNLKQIGRSEISKLLREVEQVTAEGEIEDLVFRLDEKIQQKVAWTIRYNALACIEALARANNPDILDYFTENPEDIYRNVNVVQTTVKDKAKKCLSALNLPLKRSTKAEPKETVRGIPSVGSYTEGSNEGSTGVGEPLASLPKEEKPKLTGGIKKRKTKKVVQAAVPVAAAQAQPQPADDDLFSSLSMSGSVGVGTTMPTYVQPTVAPSSNTNGDFGFLSGGISAAPTPPAPAPIPAPSNDLDFLFGASPAPRNPSPAPAPPSTNSVGGIGIDTGFMDMLMGASQSVAPPPAAAAPQQQPIDPFMQFSSSVPPVRQQPVQSVQSAPDDLFGGLMQTAMAPQQPQVAAAPQPQFTDFTSQLDSVTDHAAKMRLLEEQQALLAKQIAALQQQTQQRP